MPANNKLPVTGGDAVADGDVVAEGEAVEEAVESVITGAVDGRSS